MINQSTVTVVIAAYHREDALNRALKSIYNQTFQDWNVLIVADSCSDSFLSGIDLSDSRIALINLPERCGHQYGPNSVGLQLAKSDYVALLNHDDIWLSDHLEIAIHHLNQKKANFFLGKAAFCHSQNQGELTRKHEHLIFSEYNRPEAIWRCMTGPFYYFEPASSWVLSTAFAKKVLPWQSPDVTSPIPPIQDFIKRSALLGAQFCTCNTLSVLKFNLHIGLSDKTLPQYHHVSPYYEYIDKLLAVSPDVVRTYIAHDIEKAKERGLFFRQDLRQKLTLDAQEQRNILSFLIYKNSGIELPGEPNDLHMVTNVHASSLIKARTGEDITNFRPASEIISSLKNRSSETYMRPIVHAINFSRCQGWRTNDDSIHSVSRRYFSIVALSSKGREQIYIDQPEVGILGYIIARNYNTNMWLVQNKPEPGNVNYYQLAPTVQATPSNYQRIHGGNSTPFLENFAGNTNIAIDVEASEQGDRFINKFNRNIKCILPEPFDLHEHSYKFNWLQSKEIKRLLRQNYVMNTDSRSVIASGNWSFLSESQMFFSQDLTLEYATAFNSSYEIINKARIDAGKLILSSTSCAYRLPVTPVKLCDLKEHVFESDGIYAKSGRRVVGFYDVFMPDREVQWWQQPLFESTSRESCILLFVIDNDIAHFCLSAYPETGFLDRTEFGPTIQTGLGPLKQTSDEALDILKKSEILAQIDQSDEGGRFYRNITQYTIARWQGALDDIKAPHRIWMTLGEISNMSMHKGMLTNELRTAISLLLSYA